MTGWALILTGSVVALWAGATLARAASLWNEYGHTPPAVVTRVDAPVVPGTPIAVLDIPRVGAAGVIFEGDRPSTLLVGIGHLADTPFPWEPGNSVLAAHRDTFFRPLKHIRPGDIVRVTTGEGALEYIVRETSIVDPTAVEVLNETNHPTLTLITCYPFGYIGPAPKRFVVKAERM